MVVINIIISESVAGCIHTNTRDKEPKNVSQLAVVLMLAPSAFLQPLLLPSVALYFAVSPFGFE